MSTIIDVTQASVVGRQEPASIANNWVIVLRIVQNPPRDVTKGSKASDDRPKPNARVNAMIDMDIDGIDDVVTSALSIHFVPTSVLFDCGVSHSIV